MEELNHGQDHSLDSSKPDNEYAQGESADWGFGEDITDLLQLDDIIAEGTVIDELPSQSCEGHLGNEISQTANTPEKKTYQSEDSKENKEDDLMHIGSQNKKSLNIKIKNNKYKEDKISCDPYIIEDDVDLIEVQKDFKTSEEKKERFAIKESTRKRQRKKREKDYDFDELKEIKEIKERNAILKKNLEKYEFIETQTVKVNEGRQGIQLMSIEEADEIFEALVDNICEKNDQDVGLHCRSCGYYSENVQERIEHLKGARHAARREVRNAIRHGILESYTINTFYCTICSWFITDISSITEHILSRRHKDADLISRYKIPGVMQDSFCNNCKSILKSNKKIYFHMSIHNHDTIYYYFIQFNKHMIIKMNKKKEVYCDICKCYIRFEDTEKHLENHEEVCYYFNKGKNTLKKCQYSEIYECKWPHKCGICRGDHPHIECSLKKEKNIIPVLEHENSKLGLLHEDEYESNTSNELSKSDIQDRISYPDENDRNAYKSYQGSNLSRSPILDYSSKSPSHRINNRGISKSIQDRILYPDENDRNAYKSYQGSNLSRSPIIDSSSKSPSHRINNRGISKSNGFNGRYPIKEHPSRRHLTQSGNKQEVITNSCLVSVDVHSVDVVHSGDEDGELNLITAIVKLLEICDLLGNLGYFFANTLKIALEKKESNEDILNILREHANIILMEVIFKKLEACKRVYDMALYMKIKRGIKHLTYLIDITKSSKLRDS